MGLPFGLLVMLGVIGAAVVLFLLDRLLLWMERKGWIYYRSFEPGLGGGARGVMGTFQELVEPETRHVKEERDQRRAEIDQQSPSDK